MDIFINFLQQHWGASLGFVATMGLISEISKAVQFLKKLHEPAKIMYLLGTAFIPKTIQKIARYLARKFVIMINFNIPEKQIDEIVLKYQKFVIKNGRNRIKLKEWASDKNTDIVNLIISYRKVYWNLQVILYMFLCIISIVCFLYISNTYKHKQDNISLINNYNTFSLYNEELEKAQLSSINYLISTSFLSGGDVFKSLQGTHSFISLIKVNQTFESLGIPAVIHLKWKGIYNSNGVEIQDNDINSLQYFNKSTSAGIFFKNENTITDTKADYNFLKDVVLNINNVEAFAVNKNIYAKYCISNNFTQQQAMKFKTSEDGSTQIISNLVYGKLQLLFDTAQFSIKKSFALPIVGKLCNKNSVIFILFFSTANDIPDDNIKQVLATIKSIIEQKLLQTYPDVCGIVVNNFENKQAQNDFLQKN